MSGSKKLQDYFVDIGLPVSQRDAQILVVAGGRIAWIVGHAIGAHGAITPATGRILEIEVTDAT
jgi:tRNA(Ile)-lysidine synthase